MIILLLSVVVLIFILIKKRKEGLSNKPIMYGRMSCPYTVKMVDALKNANMFDSFVFIDTSTKSGAKKLQQAGGRGVPFFTHGTDTATGYMEPSKLVMKLKLS